MADLRKKLEIVSAKFFANRLNECLDGSDVPAQIRERAAILSKTLDIPRQIAWSLLEGHVMPSLEQLTQIADEFEVDAHWLSGQDA